MCSSLSFVAFLLFPFFCCIALYPSLYVDGNASTDSGVPVDITVRQTMRRPTRFRMKRSAGLSSSSSSVTRRTRTTTNSISNRSDEEKSNVITSVITSVTTVKDGSERNSTGYFTARMYISSYIIHSHFNNGGSDGRDDSSLL